MLSKKLTALSLALLGLAGVALAYLTGIIALFHPGKNQELTTACIFLAPVGVIFFGIGAYLYGMEEEREEAFQEYKRRQLTR